MTFWGGDKEGVVDAAIAPGKERGDRIIDHPLRITFHKGHRTRPPGWGRGPIAFLGGGTEGCN